MKWILLALLLPVFAWGQVENYTGKTAEQLSGITSGVTNIASKNYWTSNAYDQLSKLYTFIEGNSVTIAANDTTPNITDATLYFTANTSTTVIDSLAFTGITAQKKRVVIMVLDNKTQVNNTDGYLETGVDLKMKTGDILHFYYNGTKWVGGLIFTAN